MVVTGGVLDNKVSCKVPVLFSKIVYKVKGREFQPQQDQSDADDAGRDLQDLESPPILRGWSLSDWRQSASQNQSGWQLTKFPWSRLGIICRYR